ncbi:carbohydrate ABC transporter permease [Halobaculum gomorrense]|uniref:Carbohydrate ABC transporter membrane protein 1, CUT1 family n=1 Tax=Halobaculum gomorrense TaxID=43928 RepID=A0A1M5JM67_9EURY|nr:sugar ABC transporter permease [Halobaculum gomorrense]SHG41123.1 carbohydrate ABC transporter membrane protein 1, CUT1 family [Halobaculum gomorrense]
MATIEQDDDRFGASQRSFLDRILEEYGSLQGLLFLLPTLTILSVIVFYPMLVNGLLLSFKQFTIPPTVADPWVGLENYKYWLIGGGQALFVFSLKMTLLYEFVVIPLDLVVALAAALVMNEAMPARPLWRGIMLAGYASPPIAAGLVFATMEQAATYGVIYQILSPIFDIPAGGGMTANSPWAFWAIVLAKVWRDFGFMYVVFLAGVQSVPSELYEIAKVDGAGPVQRFRNITLPHLRTIIVTVVMIRTVFTVGKVAIPWAVTKGGPVNYTTFLGVAIFKQAFINWSMGRAAALGMIFAVMVVPLILIWVKTETEDFS